MHDNDQRETSVLTTLFAYNTWANLTLLDFCEHLSDVHLAATAVGGYGSIGTTLVHIVSAEVSYVARVNGKRPARPLAQNQFPGFDVLKAAVRWTGDELLQLALATQEIPIVRQQPPRPRLVYPLASLMVQAVTHSTEHRAQIATILTQVGLEPPDMSGWKYMEEMGELQDLEDGLEGA